MIRILLAVVTSFILAAPLSATQMSERSDSVGDSEQEGGAFLRPRLESWKWTVVQGPYHIGRVKMTADNGRVVECHYQGEHSLRKFTGPGQPPFSKMINPEYFGSVTHGKDGNSLNTVEDDSKLAFPESHLEYTSDCYGHLIPELIESGDLRVYDFNEQGDAVTVLLKPKKGKQLRNGVTKIVLEFVEGVAIPTRMEKEIPGEYKEINDYSEFVAVGDMVLPTKYHVEVDFGEGGKHTEHSFKIEYFPDEQLLTDMCYLEYYDIGEPSSAVFRWLIALVVGSVAFIGLLYAVRNKGDSQEKQKKR